MSLIALIFATAAFAMSALTLIRQDIHQRDVDRMAAADAQDYADLAMEIAHLRRDLEDAGLLADPNQDLDVPTVGDAAEFPAQWVPRERVVRHSDGTTSPHIPLAIPPLFGDPTAVTEPIERNHND